jgi:hypothetical protein
VSALPSLAENPAQQAECAQEDHNRCDDGEHQEGDEEGAASAAALLGEYLCRRLLRRWLSHSAFSTVDVTDVSARAGIFSASGCTIAAVSTITEWFA